MADVYRAQTNPGGSVALSGAPALDGVARGMEQAGASLERIGARQKAVDQNNENAAAAVQFAQISTGLDQAEIDGRTHAAPGGAGHTDTINKTADDQINGALGQIKDPKLRSAYEARYAELRGNVSTRAYGWEAAARSDKQVTDTGEAFDTLAKGVALNPDALGVQVSLDTVGTMSDHMDVSAELRDKLKHQGWNQVAGSFANAMIDKDPHHLVERIGGKPSLLDTLSPYLTSDQIKSLDNGAKVEIRRLDAQARAQFDRDKAQAVQGINVLGKRVTDVHDLNNITDDDFAKARAAAKKYDLPEKLIDIADWQDLRDVKQETRTWTTPQWNQAINELEAKKDKAPAENLRLKHLEQLGPAAISLINSDKSGFEARNGNPAPAIDWNAADPGALAKMGEARSSWATSAAHANGWVDRPLLTNDDLQVWQARVKQGTAGQLETAAAMRATFRTDAAAAVRQIDPSNTDLQLMVGLHPRIATLYKEGADGLKSGAIKLGAAPEDDQAMRNAFAKYMPAIPPAMQDAVYRAGLNITAGIAKEFGNTNPSGDVLTSSFEQALQRAGGRSGRVTDFNAPGGFAQWPPDPKTGRYVWLPSNVTSNQFISRISRAGAAEWAHAAGGNEPYYRGPDGKLAKMSESQVAHLKEYPLELGADAQGRQIAGVYRLSMPGGGYIGNKDGTPWQFDIRNLAPSFDAKLAAAGYSRH